MRVESGAGQGQLVGFKGRSSSWIMAARPRTLSLSITPVAVGTALAWATERDIRWPAVGAALLASVLIHLGTNLHNDAVDSERGDNGPDRLGAPRVAALGLLSISQVKHGAAACFAMAALLGIYLVLVGGWPILLLGVLSILAGWAYNGGPLPIAYTPLGEVFVVAFFGVGAVCGTYWLSTSYFGATAIEAGLAVGLLAGAVLSVNNNRDAEGDARVGRRTLAIVAGPYLTRWIYAGFMLVPFLLLPVIGQALPRGHVWPALITLPFALVSVHRFIAEPPGRGFNRILLQTVQIQSLFGLLLCLGLIV